SGDASGTSSGGGQGGSGGQSGATTSTSTGSASTSTSTGSGGTGGGSAVVHGPPGTETVSGGTLSKNNVFKMVSTLGQPTQNQGKSTGPSFRLQGGLVGANGSLP